MKTEIQKTISDWNSDGTFSGVISISAPDDILYQEAFGYRNRAEKLPNKPDTAFAIASGTKLFTALSICKLIDGGLLSLESRIRDLIPHDLKSINKEVTVFHLLTHTSGIGDYIDEEASSDYFDILRLYENRPVHKWDSLAYYLPMFNELPQKFSPGERFGYSNAGFVLLGLVVEGISKQIYQKYVTENIILPLGVFIRQDGDKKAYYSVGGDFGVDYFSAYFPQKEIIASALGNTEINTFPLFKRLFEVLG